MKHRERHKTDVPDCFGCHVLSVDLLTANLIRDREQHTTQREIERDIINAAKEDGRDLARPSDFPNLEFRQPGDTKGLNRRPKAKVSATESALAVAEKEFEKAGIR